MKILIPLHNVYCNQYLKVYKILNTKQNTPISTTIAGDIKDSYTGIVITGTFYF